MPTPYPHTAAERDRWIRALRPARAAVHSGQPQAAFLESEPAASGELEDVATIILTTRECTWRCLMCDLWRHTLDRPTPVGAVPEQLRAALARLAGPDGRVPARQVKLYNAGSFFDTGAVPRADHADLARALEPFARVIVECHPRLVGPRVLGFRDRLAGTLEVAMGLETVHPEVLARLNKGMTAEDFRRAAGFLVARGMAVRAFVLVQPPFLGAPAAVEWTCRSTGFAFDSGATVVSLIPTRFGNGALEALAEAGAFTPPRLETIEAALERGLALGRGRGRVFVDLWDAERWIECPDCGPARLDRLRRMNREQRTLPPIGCVRCRSGGGDGGAGGAPGRPGVDCTAVEPGALLD